MKWEALKTNKTVPEPSLMLEAPTLGKQVEVLHDCYYISILRRDSIVQKMTTHFITAEIDLKQTPAQLQQSIEQELNKKGEPLRWSIALVDARKQKAVVEAIVTK